MRIRYENIFNDEPALRLATTNNVVNYNTQSLVMGAGVAKQFKDRYPGIEKRLANYFSNGEDYGLIVLPDNTGAFQTKRHWRNPSKLEIIQFSTSKLFHYAIEHPDISIFLPFPGIGKGGLKREVVEPVISVLPDNVSVFIYGK